METKGGKRRWWRKANSAVISPSFSGTSWPWSRESQDMTTKGECVSWLPMDKQRTECHFDFNRSLQNDEHQDRHRHRARSSGMAQIINCIYKLSEERASLIVFVVGSYRFSCDILAIISSTHLVSLTSRILETPPRRQYLNTIFFLFFSLSWNRYQSWRTKLMLSALPLSQGKWTSRFEMQNRFFFTF